MSSHPRQFPSRKVAAKQSSMTFDFVKRCGPLLIRCSRVLLLRSIGSQCGRRWLRTGAFDQSTATVHFVQWHSRLLVHGRSTLETAQTTGVPWHFKSCTGVDRWSFVVVELFSWCSRLVERCNSTCASEHPTGHPRRV